jgi:hypothetical protein
MRPRLDRGATAEEVEQDGDYGENQKDVNESAGYVKRREAQQPKNQENSGDDR